MCGFSEANIHIEREKRYDLFGLPSEHFLAFAFFALTQKADGSLMNLKRKTDAGRISRFSSGKNPSDSYLAF